MHQIRPISERNSITIIELKWRNIPHLYSLFPVVLIQRLWIKMQRTDWSDHRVYSYTTVPHHRPSNNHQKPKKQSRLAGIIGTITNATITPTIWRIKGWTPKIRWSLVSDPACTRLKKNAKHCVKLWMKLRSSVKKIVKISLVSSIMSSSSLTSLIARKQKYIF